MIPFVCCNPTSQRLVKKKAISDGQYSPRKDLLQGIHAYIYIYINLGKLCDSKRK